MPTQVQQNGIVNDRKRMKTVENDYRYDDRLRCTGKRRNNLLNDGRLRLPFTCHRKGWLVRLSFIAVYYRFSPYSIY
jgi:hypothetical protein